MQLDKLTNKDLGQLFPIIISEPMTEWVDLFNTEKNEIENVIGLNSIIRIEHIGSTAIPDLKAKPTIDILLEITDNANENLIIDSLKSLNYHYISKPENPSPHMMFVKGYSSHGFQGQAYHIHVRYIGDWDELYFRDYLIQNPDIAQEYASLKLQLAKEYKNDREAYTGHKTEFIRRITDKARSCSKI
ncbi:MAG: GrpB family protein [Bacteroidetes bacterium]|nr:GrpB family protein [Bacteroidota bacterium]